MSGSEKYPIAAPETFGEPVEIVQGVYWVRLPLPFKLDHVNVYLLRDEDGWTAIDSGVNNANVQAGWLKILAFIGGDKQLKRLIMTHHHIDHIGMAGWLQARTGCAVLMSRVEHETALRGLLPDPPDRAERARAHLTWLGCGHAEVEDLTSKPFRSNAFVEPIPQQVGFIEAGEIISLAGRKWRLLSGRGHSPSPLMFLCESEPLLIAGDQILSTISPFVGTFGDAPLASPLRDYLAFLTDDIGMIPADALVLPGHGRVFYGVQERIAELHRHHVERCDLIIAACRETPLSVRDLVDRLFKRSLEGVMPLAMAETLVHANLLVEDGRLHAAEQDGARRFSPI